MKHDVQQPAVQLLDYVLECHIAYKHNSYRYTLLEHEYSRQPHFYVIQEDG